MIAYFLCSNKTDRFKRLQRDKLHLHYCCNTHYLGVPSLLLSPVGHRCYSQMLVTQNMEWQVTFPATTPLWLRKDMLHLPSCYLNPPPDHGRTGYISPPATIPPWLCKDKLHFPFCYHTPTPWFRKDKLHFPSCYHTPLTIDGQVTFPLLLPHPPWLLKDKLQ